MRTADGYIIKRCLNGDSAAFGLLVDKYRTGVYALAYSKLRDFQDAEDAAQEVFIKAYKKLRSLKRFDCFHAWLYAITSNLCKDWLRARARRPDREYIEDQNTEVLEAPSIYAYQEKLVWEQIHEALNSLPAIYQQALTLYYLGGMNSREIAEFVGTSPAAIRERLVRARSQLKEGILAMMSTNFEARRLFTSFTFRIVEAVRRIKINPMPRATGLPWGLSTAAGIIVTVMILSPHLGILNVTGAPMSSALPGETRVLETGKISVDILKISQIPALASKQGDDDDGAPEPPQHTLMAAQGEADSWTTKGDMPTARFGLSTCVVDGKIYAIGGGKTGFEPFFSTVEEYDPETDTWTTKADMPTARVFVSTCVVNGKIYAIGGAAHRETGASTVEEYDPARDTWTTKAEMPTARYWLSTSAVNGKIYAIGGQSGPGSPISTVEEYDPETDTWTTKADMTTPRQWVSTSVVNGKIYAIGGDVSGKGAGPALRIVEEYDPATDTWTAKADMPTARKALFISVVNGKVYAIGGIENNTILYSVVEEYDPATDTWVRKTDMPTARCLGSASAVDGKIYAIGGSVARGSLGAPIPTVEVYDTGFMDLSTVGPKKKHVRTWGEVKSE